MANSNSTVTPYEKFISDAVGAGARAYERIAENETILNDLFYQWIEEGLPTAKNGKWDREFDLVVARAERAFKFSFIDRAKRL